MCTIIAAVRVWPTRPLVIAANRDELLDRPAGEARVWAPGEAADRRVLAPRDLRAGGTWLGVNDAGLFVGITNRRALPDPRRRSRGELVFEALGAEDHRAARARIAALSARDYNPFHLLFADRSGASVVWSDGERLHELELGPGVHWMTERSFGAAASERHGILEQRAEELASGTPPDVEGWRSILADHRPHDDGDDPPGRLCVGLDSVCVHASPIKYGTRSSTLVELGEGPGDLRFFHAGGRPCEHPLIERPEAVAELLEARSATANPA
ncbi:MAG: NRDE family protein [Enhygromyxa sp.]